MTLFVTYEKKQVANHKPYLLDMSLFGLKSFSLGNVAALIVGIGEFGLLFVLPLLLQNIMSLRALESGKILAWMGLGAFLAG